MHPFRNRKKQEHTHIAQYLVPQGPERSVDLRPWIITEYSGQEIVGGDQEDIFQQVLVRCRITKVCAKGQIGHQQSENEGTQ
ncbi:hypothetical protein D3C80_1607120 [compost metagenome]